ncbi:MAG: 50S ribosomal protein L23 [Patescibacteria group bacterium]
MAMFGNKKTEAKEIKETKSAPKKEKTTSATPAATSMQDLYNESAVKTVKSGAKTVKVAVVSDAYRILVKPLVTEKATNLGEHNKYVFVVALKANKIQVAKAIEALYGVKPVKVNISNVSGKKVARGKIRGVRSDWRKAVVTLPAGQTIKIYEGV